MKKTVAFFLSVVMVFTLLPAFLLNAVADAPTDPLPGSSEYTQNLIDEGYLPIETFSDIVDFNSTSAKYYLTADVVYGAKISATFKGTLDGNGHTVYNSANSLFTLQGTLKNLTFSKYTDEEGTDTFQTTAPLLSGIADGAVLENIVSNRIFNEVSDFWGTIVRAVPANASVTFKNVINNSSIFFPWTAYNIKIGGFIGLAEQGSNITFENCVNNGDVKGSQAGGFIAVVMGNNTISFKNCENKGLITGSIGKGGQGDAAYGIAGGFIGSYNNSDKRDKSLTISFEDCVNSGHVIRWQGTYAPTHKGTKIAQGGLIGTLGEGSNSYNLTLTVKNCKIKDCQIGASTTWQDELDTNGAVITDYTQGHVGAIIGWLGTINTTDAITIENVTVRNVTIECADPAHASLFLNTDGTQKPVTLKNCFAISCKETRAATGDVRFSYTADPSDKITVNKTQKSAVKDEKMALRFLGSIDSLNYDGIGFVVEQKEGDSRTYYFLFNKKAYNEVKNGTEKLSKADFGGNYITAEILDGISATNTNTVRYTVTPYAIDTTGNLLVGTAKYISLTAGNLS